MNWFYGIHIKVRDELTKSWIKSESMCDSITASSNTFSERVSPQ